MGECVQHWFECLSAVVWPFNEEKKTNLCTIFIHNECLRLHKPKSPIQQRHTHRISGSEIFPLFYDHIYLNFICFPAFILFYKFSLYVFFREFEVDIESRILNALHRILNVQWEKKTSCSNTEKKKYSLLAELRKEFCIFIAFIIWIKRTFMDSFNSILKNVSFILSSSLSFFCFRIFLRFSIESFNRRFDWDGNVRILVVLWNVRRLLVIFRCCVYALRLSDHGIYNASSSSHYHLH